MHNETHYDDRLRGGLPTALGWLTVAVAGGTAIFLCARHFSAASRDLDGFAAEAADEQAVTVRVPLEKAEAAWIQWCASGQAKLNNDYAVRFEPAPGARGTEVHLSGGGSKARTREELRRFKQVLETGEVTMSDGPDLRRAAQPSGRAQPLKSAEVL